MMISNACYEDFAPVSDFLSEKECDTLLLYLPGFKKDQLKVQLTTSRILRVSGERPIGENKWKRFQKEFHVPSNIDTKEMTAKFEGGILYIRQPKLITPEVKEQHEEKPAKKPPKPQEQEQPPKPELQQEAPSEKKTEKEDQKKEDEEKKEKSQLDEINKQLGGRTELFKELRKLANLKRFTVYVVLIVILAFHTIKMFKSINKVEEHSNLEYDQEL